jgi:hypothetical protein
MREFFRSVRFGAAGLMLLFDACKRVLTFWPPAEWQRLQRAFDSNGRDRMSGDCLAYGLSPSALTAVQQALAAKLLSPGTRWLL